MKRLVLIGFAVLGLAVVGGAGATTIQAFHATFQDVSFQNTCTPPVVFCGSGNVAGYGQATTVVRVTRNAPSRQPRATTSPGSVP
jgi:hypothetical protein